MPTNAPPAALDLLVVGGLTVDRFRDGSRSPGGSVLHATRAATLGGRRAAAIVLAGPEPEAGEGVRELARLAGTRVVSASRSIGFDHAEGAAGRRIRFAGSGGRLTAPLQPLRPLAVLYAPVAAELGPDLAGQEYAGALTGAILQGWLRRLEPGAWAEPLLLTVLPTELRTRLASCALLVASTEDLARVGGTPRNQLAGLRHAFGDGPVVVVTAGHHGAWLDAAGRSGQVPVETVVERTSTVGAGDAFSAGMLLALADGEDPTDAVAAGHRLAAAYLATRSVAHS